MKKVLYSIFFTFILISNLYQNSVASGYNIGLNLPIGTISILGGVNGECLYNNNGLLGEQTCGVATSIGVGSTNITGGTDKYLLFNNAGILGNESVASILTSPPSIGNTTPNTGTFTDLNIVDVTSSILPKADRTYSLGDGSHAYTETFTNTIQMNGATSGAIGFQAADTTTNYSFKWPPIQGTSGQTLSDDGTGNLSWINPSGTRPAFFQSNISTQATGKNETYCIIEDANGYIYYCYGTSPAKIDKYVLATDAYVATLTLNSGENYVVGAAIDPSTNQMYIGTFTSTAILVKVDLNTFTRVGSITVHVDSTSGGTVLLGKPSIIGTNLYISSISSTNTPEPMNKVNLSTFTFTSYINSPANTRGLYNGTYDGSRYIYWGVDRTTVTGPQVVKYDTQTDTFPATLTFASGQDKCNGVAIDNTATYAYGVTNTSPVSLVQINLSTFTEVAAYVGLGNLSVTFPLFNNGNVYYGSYSSPSIVNKFNTSTLQTDSITLTSNLYLSNYISTNGILFIGNDTSPGMVTQVDLFN